MRKRLAIILIAAATALGLAACGSGDDASREDAHDVPGNQVDKTAPNVNAFTNHYPNVSHKCDGVSGHRLFVTTDGVLVVLPDPTCPGYENSAGEVVEAAGAASGVGVGPGSIEVGGE